MEPMTDRLAGLSPEKRALFEAILRKKRAEAMATLTIPPRGSSEGAEGPLPLSFSQERLWLIQQLDPESAAYNIPLVLRFTGDLSVEALRESLAAIVRRHESLRTRFETVESRPVQVIDPAGCSMLPLMDLTALPVEIREAEADRLARQEALRPFDLRQGPVFRATLLRLSVREHALVVNLHHIVSDGWSSGVFARELGLFYQAFTGGKPAELPALPIQYADYALWQRRTLDGAALEKQLAYWRQRLACLDPVLELPADHPRPTRRSERGELRRFSLPEPLARDLEGLSGRQKTTLFATLLAGFFALLHRQSGRDSLCVGTPVAGRRHAETEGLIGFFVNTLVLRSDRAGDPPFREHLTRVHEGVLDAQANQDVPFERLVLELAPERSLSHTPIFQVLFALQNAPAPPLELPGLAIRGQEVAASAAKLDLSLSVGPAGTGLDGALEYSLDLFEGPTVARLLNQLRTLLEGAAADPERRLSDLPLLGLAERRQILEEWNDTGDAAVAGLCLHELFAAQVARTPGAVALRHRDESVTYAELAARAGGLASWLLARGIVPETRVAVCLDRSIDLVAALLGVLAAGGAYVPVDPAYPVERRALMLEDSGAAVLVTRGRLAADLPVTGARVLDLDAETVPITEGLPAGLAVLPGNLAYLIYTSGSTGRPKAVAIEHRSAVALAGWARETFSTEELAGVLAGTSVCFDLSVFEIFTPLAWGGRVLLAENALELPSLPYASEVRVLNTVPSAAAELVRGGSLPASVRTVSLAGEPLPAALAARLYATGTVERVLNLYGPSEDTTYSTGSLVERAGRTPAIGRPLPGTRAYVVDREGQPVPVGVAGELWLAGAGLARGYLGRPELTAERFAPDPFAVQPGERVYRTGDLVRHRPDGELEFLGRIDHQVKVRGFRIELGEVEATLVSHPAVEDSVCLVRDSALVAYLAGAPDLDELRAHLGRRLPEYMVPSVFVVLDALPRTPNGKVDRKALPDPGWGRGEDESYVAPTDPLEELLAGFWGEVLGVERVGIHDNFFSLGGHSLLATQVISRVREALGVELPQREIFEAPTVAALTRAVRAAREAGGAIAPPITPVPRDQDLPLSFSQQRLWFLDRFEPGNPAYNIPFPVRLTGELPVERLERVFAEVVRRHEALRTTFGTRGGQPVQVIAPELRPRLAILDLSGLPAGEREERARGLAAAEARQPFDLEAGPLLRLTLLRLAEREHVLLMTLHHIVSDGWSMSVLLREIAVLYEAFAADRPSPLPELPVQYADFALWQRGWLRGEVLEAQLAYWKGQLAEAPKLLELPADRPRPAVQTYRGASRDLELAPALSAAVRDLCRREGVTPFMALLGAWGVLLARHAGLEAGQEEVLVGTPVAGRNRREIEGLIGFFVNTLVLRVDLRGAPTFSALLGRVRSAALDAFQHQDLPFERIVEELIPERDLSHPPLVQVLFALQNAPRAEVELPGLSLAPVAVDGRVARLDLTLTLQEGAEGFAAALEHNTDLFDGSTAARLLARFEALLSAAVAEPGQIVVDLPLLLEAERQQVLAEWNDTRSTFPREASLPELFEAVAAERPDATALVSEEEVWSYRRLDEAANRLARRLRGLGVGPETAVGLSLERSPELILGTLAILKAGGVYVPLDAGYPDDRLDFMLADTGAEIVLVHEKTRARFEGRRARLVSLDALEAGDASPLRLQVPAESLAYVIYTSGSTGRPKGVAVPHRAIVRLVRATNYVRLGADDRTGHVANISFDAATYEIWGALLNGGAIAIIPREVVLSPADFARSLRELRVTSMFLTSALFTKMSREEPEAFAGLNELLVGGEAVDPSAARIVLAGRPPRRLLNGYGPTESTTFAAWHPIREVPPEATSIPIGLPLGNTSLHVVGRHLSPVPPGVAGELLIGGDGLARGYLNRPELTAERFVPNPWEVGGRLYRTGDLVRQRADGAIEFLGRLDNQVKIRGFRIEPGEIEAVLAGHPEVRECAVLALRGPEGLRLVACVSGPVRAEALRGWLQERLPDYMVPSAFVLLESLPLTPNGKVDRKAVATLAVAAPETAREEGAAPRDPVEELLAGLWAEVLRLDRVGLHDDFFALGGHSLLATQVMSRLRAVLGVELPLRELFERPTVAALAEAVRAARQGEEAPAIVPVPRDRDLPLSFAQQRLWFLDQLEPGNPAYNVPFPVRLSGEIRVDLLERVFAEVVRRHEALRTTFETRDGEPVQVIAAESEIRLPLLDLSHLPEGEREARARELAEEDALRPFDLRDGPLLRLALLRLAPDDHVLLIALHHIVSDGWSMGVLLREIAVLHEAIAAGRPSPLPELPVQYADFAVWQREWLRGEVLEGQLAYWKDRLAGAPAALELPTDRPRPAAQTYVGAVRETSLGPGLSAAIRDLCRREGVTPFMALLAAWAVLLGRHAGQDDVVVGSPIAGRNRREIEGLIGFFVNTLALRVDLRGGLDFASLLRQVRQTALDAFAHQDLPFERLVEELVAERDFSRSPLFQVMLLLQNATRGDVEIPGLALAPVAVEGRLAKFDLTLTLQEGAGGFAAGLEHNTDLFDGSTAERLLARFAALLEAAAAEPGKPIADLPLLLPAERRQILEDWNAPGEAPASGPCLHELFAAQAARTPAAVALVHGSGRWTYAELAARAGGVARQLLGLGVLPEARVAVCLERSPDLVATLLGVLAAGGAYVPVDPAYPVERRALMLEDSGAAVLVTRGRLAADLPRTGARVLDLDLETPNSEPVRTSGGLPAVPVLPENLAYLIYTSGSTGRPKAVAIEHRSAVALAGWARETFSAEDLAGVLAATSVCFDLSVFEIFTPLAWGGRVLLAENALELPSLPYASEVRLLNTVPSAAAELVRAGSLPASVRTVNLAGEPLPAILADRLYATGTVERVLNLYGPSEDTTYSTGSLVARGADRMPAIGRPLPGTRAYVVDREGWLAPPGVAGELWLAGAGLARGYLGRPELTAERFTPDPFAVRPGERVYRTGDLVRFRPPFSPDSELEFLGRIDHQVKVRGFRIELGEVEAALAGHPAVEDCVCVVRDAALVAYLVGTAGADELRDFLSRRLPASMVPSTFVVLEALPRTPNGKVDRKALPTPGQIRVEATFEPPRDEVELRLARIWEDLLGVGPVGRRDSFFALGGHSLLALRVVGAIERDFGRKLPLAALMQASTLERLAGLVRQEATASGSLVIPIRPGSGTPLFLVHPVGGNVFCYLPLAGQLGDRPIYGIQSPDPGALSGPWTIEALAALYVEALRAVQPEGPCQLAGWSLGGLVAYEMARQLETQGREVARLVLIDAAPPGSGPGEPDPRLELAWFVHDLRGLAGLSGSGPLQLPADSLDALLEKDEVRALLPAEVSPDRLRELFALFRANLRAQGSYRPAPYGGRLTLIRAAETAAALPADADEAWSALTAGGAEIRRLPGDHYALLTPAGAAALAALLRGLL